MTMRGMDQRWLENNRAENERRASIEVLWIGESVEMTAEQAPELFGYLPESRL